MGKRSVLSILQQSRSEMQADEVVRSENHHPPIIDKASFCRIQEMKKMRSNNKLDEQGNKVRKSTHYSMKNPSDIV